MESLQSNQDGTVDRPDEHYDTYIQIVVYIQISCELKKHYKSHLLAMLCSMEANGVTPMPAPIRTACSAWKMCKEGVPYGPSMKTYSNISMYHIVYNQLKPCIPQASCRLHPYF